MEKDGSVTFGDWNTGQAKHPIYGHGLLQNVEVFENRGIAGLKPYLASDTYTYGSLPIAKVEDFVLTNNGSGGTGQLLRAGTVLATGLSDCWDMVKYKDYIWVRYGANLGAYGPLASAPQWFGGIITTFPTDFYGKIIAGQDDFLYTGAGNEVVKLEVTASGTPTVAPTVVTSATLDLKDGQYVVTIAEYGTKIIVGTQGSEGFYNTSLEPKAKLYAWNRQAGTLGNPGLADLPIEFKEDRINAIISHQNKLYVSAGTAGNIYMTDSTNYVKISQLPYTLNSFLEASRVLPNAMTISKNGTLLVGISAIQIYADSVARYGVYEIAIDLPDYPTSLRTLASQQTSSVLGITLGFVYEDFLSVYVGWEVGGTYGVDKSAPFIGNSYLGIIETKLVRVGGYNTKKTFQFIEWCLATPLTDSQSIHIYYRGDVTSNYTLIGGWGNGVGGITDVGNVSSFQDAFGSTSLEYVQLKIRIDSPAVLGNMQLLTVKIW